MNTSRKGKAPDRGNISQPRFHSSPKRPAAAGEASPSARAPKRQRISVPDLLEDDSNERSPSGPAKGAGKKGADTMQSTGRDAFANMYDFGSTKVMKEDVNGTASLPLNGKPKPAFA